MLSAAVMISALRVEFEELSENNVDPDEVAHHKKLTTVELHWLEHLWNYENTCTFKIAVVRANEC